MALSLPMQLDVTEVNGADCASDLLPPGGPWEQRGVTVPECKRGPPAVGTRGTTGDGLSSRADLPNIRRLQRGEAAVVQGAALHDVPRPPVPE